MVEIKVKTQTPITPTKNVSFQNEPTELETSVMKTVQEFAGTDSEMPVILDFIRKSGKKVAYDPTFISEIANNVIDYYSNKKKDECPLPDKPDPVTSPQVDSGQTTDPVQFGPQNSSDKKYLTLEEDSDLQRALQESLKVTSTNLSTFQASFPEDLETVVRDPKLSTGLHNAGNTCWFNCVAQILYHLPKFRSIIYHCVPYSWSDTSTSSSVVTPETALPRDLLLRIRSLFAEMQFSTMAYIDTTPVLEVVDALTRKNSSEVSVLGQQQDATESLIRIIDWLESGIKDALNDRNRTTISDDLPTVENMEDDQSYIPANSVSNAPNSDVIGIAPPSYDAVSYTTIEGSSKCTFEGTPSKKQKEHDNIVINTKIAASPTTSFNDEPMDVSEDQHPPPDPHSHPRKGSSSTQHVSIAEKIAVDSIKQNLKNLFTATCVTATYSDEISNSLPETTVQNCPQFFHLQVSYGDLHDALEATTFDTGRGDTSHVQNFFESLPAAIFMGISRFNYKNGMPEKLHNQFVFPKTLYMDRYLKKNAKKVLELRRQQLVDRETLGRQRAVQRGLKHYPFVGNQTTRIVDTFETVIDVLRNARADRPPPPKSPNVLGPFVPPSPYPSEENGSRFIENFGIKYPEVQRELYPSIEDCLQTLEQISLKFREDETILEVQDMQLLEKINTTYDIDELKQCEYQLHALIIHSGEANRGHYWAYARSQEDQWEKLNDTHIDIVPWSRVEKDAFGNGNASSPSAYCLLYVRSDAKWLMDPDSLTREESRELLPTDLKEMINSKIEEFNSNLERFREEKETKSRPFQAPTTSPKSPSSNKEEKSFQIKKEQWGYERPRVSNNEDDDVSTSAEKFSLVTQLNAQNWENFHPETEIQVQDSISRISRVLREVMPRKFIDDKTLLNNQCDSLMMNYGKPFLKQILGFDAGELRADAENDANRAFDTFIRDFLTDITAPESHCLVTFIHTVVRGFNMSVIRFILLVALSRSRVAIISNRAAAEIEQLKSQSLDQFVSICRLAQWASMLYELVSVMFFSCRKALEYFLGQLSDPSKCSQNSYYGLVSSRMARYCHQMIVSELHHFGSSPLNLDNIIDYGIAQLTTCLSLATLVLEMTKYSIDETKSLHDLTFFMEERERRITEDDLSREVKYGTNALKIWIQNDIGTCGRIKSSTVAMFQTLKYAFEKMKNAHACTINSEKVFFVAESLKIYNGEEVLEADPLPQYFESESFGIPSENIKIKERLNELMSTTSMNDRFNNFNEELKKLIEQAD